MTLFLLACLLLGAVAGFLAGLLGIGGGLVIVPALVFLFAWQGFPANNIMHLALATSLATIIPTSLSSIRAHHARGSVLWPVVRHLTPGLVLGATVTTLLANHVHSDILQRFFSLFVACVSVQMIFNFMPRPRRQLPAVPGMMASGFGIGGLSSLLGIGGGALTTPFLLWCNTALPQAIATSAAAGLPIAVAGSIGYAVSGLNAGQRIDYSIGFVYIPAFVAIVASSILLAPLGARLTYLLPVTVLKRMFAVILAGVAWKLWNA